MPRIPFTRTRKQHRAVLIACRDSKAQVESLMRYRGYDLQDFLLLSRKDDPSLKTLDDIIAALPESVELVVLDDVEHLLPEGERSPSCVKTLLEAARIRYAHRGLTLMASMTSEGMDGLAWVV
jgi:hypothetical protein